MALGTSLQKSKAGKDSVAYLSSVFSRGFDLTKFINKMVLESHPPKNRQLFVCYYLIKILS